MKVVINRCFGGFGLSEKAFEMVLNRKGIDFEKIESKYKIGDHQHEYYAAGHVGDDDHYLSCYDLSQDRSDADLVAVIEELGEESWGWASELAVVEIPDGIEWYIHEYDGMEHVAEEHRTWR